MNIIEKKRTTIPLREQVDINMYLFLKPQTFLIAMK